MVSGGLACIKYLVFAFNLLFFLAGCGILGVGVWLRVEKGDYAQLTEHEYVTASNLAIAAGAIIVVVTFLGCVGAIKENKPMLLMFFIFLLLIFCLEIAAGGLAYANRGKIETKLREDLNKTIDLRYTKEDGTKKAVDKFQKEFKCCGNYGYDDWYYSDYYRTSQGKLPKSCCKKEFMADTTCQTADGKYYKEGCYEKVKKFLMDHLTIIGGIGIAFGIIQILGMVFAMVLYCAITKEGEVV